MERCIPDLATIWLNVGYLLDRILTFILILCKTLFSPFKLETLVGNILLMPFCTLESLVENRKSKRSPAEQKWCLVQPRRRCSCLKQPTRYSVDSGYRHVVHIIFYAVNDVILWIAIIAGLLMH
jgi:hypothetical protein